jgi:outer membrane receptor protein involved in Fe transport
MIRKTCSFFISMMVVALVCFGQTSTSGGIVGTVTDPDGVALPGVVVKLTSPDMVIKEMSTITNVNGVYRFMSLLPGTYELTFAFEGMNTMVRSGIIVNLGKTSTIDVQMALKTLEERIVVYGKTPTVDRQTVTKSSNFTTEFLEYIPAVRTLGTFFNLTPGVTGDTAHGSSVRDTSYNLDGVNLTDATVGTQGVFFGMDIMEEVSVETGALPAEYGQARGSILNIVTKSGGNKLRGSASIYYRNDSLQSTNTKGTPLEGEKSGFKYEFEPGVNLGGALIKDKLWFFVNLSFKKSETIVSGYPYDKQVETPTDDYQPYPYVKLTFQPNKNNRFVLSYNHSNILYHHRGASRYNTEQTTWEQKTPTHTFNLHWLRNFGSNLYMNFKVGGYTSEFNMLRKNHQPVIYDYVTGLYSGSAGYDDLNRRDRFQLNVDGTLFIDDLAGSHEMKFGGEYLYSWTGRALNFSEEVTDGSGFYAYSYNEYYGPYSATYYAPYDTKANARNWALFLQDTWEISKNLILNLGIRYENQTGIIPPQNQDEGDLNLRGIVTFNRGVHNTIKTYTWSTFSPRLSLNYDFFSDGTTLFKASFSRYYIANLTNWFIDMNPNGWAWYYGYANADMQVVSLWGYGASTPKQAGWGDHKLKAPYVDEVTIGFERELWEDWSISARYIKKWDRNLLEDTDPNQIDVDALVERGELIWTNWAPITITDPYDGSTQTFWNQLNVYPAEGVVINPKGAKRDYDSVEFILNKRFSKGWLFNLSYVWQNSRGLIATDYTPSWGGTALFENPNVHENAVGRFRLERRHQVKAMGMIKGPLGINVGGYFRYLSGNRYQRQIRSVDNGINLNQGVETIYAEARGSRGLPALVILDLKLEKAFKIGPATLRGFVDVFNVLNNNKATSVVSTSGHPTLVFEEMVSIQAPRIFRLGAKVEF